MKKNIIYIVGLLLIIIITSGSTYAFFSATTGKNNAITSTGDVLEVIYSGDREISGNLKLVSTKEEGYNRNIKIGLSERSVGAKSNLFIQLETITSNIAIDGLKWEVYKKVNGTEEYVKSGTFMQCGEINGTKSKCTNGSKLYIVTGYELSTTITDFVVYLWLNGNEVGNSVLGGTVIGYIAAETENITAEIS